MSLEQPGFSVAVALGAAGQLRFQGAGLAWPPVFGTSFSLLAREAALAPRESELLWYYDHEDPVDAILIEDVTMDLSQARSF